MNARKLLTVLMVVCPAFLDIPTAQACHRRHRQDRSCRCLSEETPASVLRWRLEKGVPFYEEMTVQSTQDLIIQGNMVRNTINHKIIFRWLPIGRDNQGHWKVAQRIEDLKSDFHIGGSSVLFDLARKLTGGGSKAKVLRAIIGSEFVYTLDRDFKIIKIEGVEAFLERLEKLDSRLKAVLTDSFSNTVMGEEAQNTLIALPKMALTPGDFWNRAPGKFGVGSLGDFTYNYQFTYSGKTADDQGRTLDRITKESAITFTLRGEDKAGLPFKTTFPVFPEGKSTGTVLFDNAKGRIDSSLSEITFGGSLSVEIAGMTTPVELIITQKVHSRYSDTPK